MTGFGYNVLGFGGATPAVLYNVQYLVIGGGGAGGGDFRSGGGGGGGNGPQSNPTTNGGSGGSGKIVVREPAVSQAASATGVWTLEEQYEFLKAGNWPS